VHRGLIFANNQLYTQFFFMYISILYMFGAVMCPSSGELIVSIRHLVYVTVYKWPSGVQVWMRQKRLYFFLTHCGRVTQICVFNTVNLGTSASSP